MEEIFICNECIKIAVEPVKLKCVHTFCMKCAQNLVLVSYVNTLRKDVFSCPICKKHTELKGDFNFNQNDDLKLASQFFLQSFKKMNSDKSSLLEFYQDVKSKKIKKSSQQQKAFQSLNGMSGDIAIPYAYCELCDQEEDKLRAVCECLNCNIPLCQKCKTKHLQNPRLSTHKIIQYQQMIFSKGSSKDQRAESPTPKGFKGTSPTTKTGQSVSSANSSGKFSIKHVLAGNDNAKESLELMICPSHEGQQLDHYSINIREFMCKICIQEIEGTQREADLNPIAVDDAIRILEGRMKMQTLVNLDEKIRSLLDLVKRKRDFCSKDKEESLKIVNKQFEILYRRLEERKNLLFQRIIAISDQEMSKIDSLIESMTAVKDRSIQMFQPIQSSSAIGYARSLERIIDFINDMKDIELPHKLTNDFKVNLNTEEILKQIDKLGSIKQFGSDSLANTQNGLNLSEDFTLVTNDFSKPKNKLPNSKILPEIAQSIKILKALPHFKDSKLLYRWSKDPQSNEQFHQNCDNKGPLLIFVKLENSTIFGGFSGIQWNSIGGWRKTKQSYIFSITDVKGREPFISQVRNDNPEAKLRAVYFSDRYGIVFGTSDLVINFSNMEASSSKLGSIYEIPNGMNELALAGQEKDWVVNEIEIFGLVIYK